MDKLKTLKDFEPNYRRDSFIEMPKENLIKELRQNVIKWIKAIQLNYDEWMEDKPFSNEKVANLCDYNEQEVIKFLKNFFNITEEDLK